LTGILQFRQDSIADEIDKVCCPAVMGPVKFLLEFLSQELTGTELSLDLVVPGIAWLISSATHLREN